MSKTVSEPIDYIFQSVNKALMTRDFQYAEKLLTHTLQKRKNLTPEERKTAEELLARVYVRANNLEKALESCLALYNEKPDDVDTMNTLGVLYRQLYRFDESLAILNKAKEREPDNEGVFYNLGKTYQEMKQYQKAVECFSAALDLKPEDVSTHDFLGGLYVQLHQHDKAIASYQKGLQWDPNNPSINFHLAELLQSEKRYEEAIIYYKTALKTQPDWKEAVQNIASLYVLLNKLDDALRTYKALLRISGKSAPICTEIGILFEQKNLITEAEHYFREALSFDSGYAPAALALALLLKKTGHTEEILPILLTAQASPKNTENYPLYFQTIEACISVRDYAKAQEILQTLEKSGADELAVLKLQGKLAALMGDTDKAEKTFEKIITLAPASIEFRKELAEQYLKTGKYNEAKEQLTLFLTGKPNDIDARMLLGKTEELLNNPKQAYDIYQKIIQDAPDTIDARAALSQLLHKHGNILEALQTADEMVSLQCSGATEDDMQGLTDSLELYEKAVENYISDPALTKNLEKLKIDAAAEFVSSEELAAAAYHDDLFPLFDETSSLIDPDASFDIFTESADSAFVDDEVHEEKTESLEDLHLMVEMHEPDSEVPYGQATAVPVQSSAHDDSIPAAAAEPQQLDTLHDETPAAEECTNSTAAPLPDTPKEPPYMPSDSEAPASDPAVNAEPEAASAYAQPAAAAPALSIIPTTIEHISDSLPAAETDAKALEPQPPTMKVYTTPYNTEMLDAAVQSLTSIVSHLNTSVEAVQKNNLADEIVEQVTSSILDKVHELSEARYHQAAAPTSAEPLPLPTEQPNAETPQAHTQTPLDADFDTTAPDSISALEDVESAALDAAELGSADADFASPPAAVEPVMELSEIDAAESALQENALPGAEAEHEQDSDQDFSAAAGEHKHDTDTMQWFRMPHTLKDAADFNTYLDSLEGETLAGMLIYMKELFSFLPSKTLGTFLTSRQRMQIQYIIARLSGELGLKDRAELLQKQYGYAADTPHALDRSQIIGLFEYLHDLCVELTDEGLQIACMRVLDQLLTDFWRITEPEEE